MFHFIKIVYLISIRMSIEYLMFTDYFMFNLSFHTLSLIVKIINKYLITFNFNLLCLNIIEYIY